MPLFADADALFFIISLIFSLLIYAVAFRHMRRLIISPLFRRSLFDISLRCRLLSLFYDAPLSLRLLFSLPCRFYRRWFRLSCYTPGCHATYATLMFIRVIICHCCHVTLIRCRCLMPPACHAVLLACCRLMPYALRCLMPMPLLRCRAHTMALMPMLQRFDAAADDAFFSIAAA